MVKVKSTINKDKIVINKDAKKAVKTSTFLVTINSNRSDNGLIDYELLLKQYKSMLKYLFSEENAMSLLECKACDTTDKSTGGGCNCVDFESKIESIDIKTSLEVGRVCSKLHSHSFIKVEHTTKVHINKGRVIAIGKYFMSKINMPGIYVDVKYVNSGVSKALRYVSHGADYVPVSDLN